LRNYIRISYVTFNDLYSGIYISQVINVLNLYKKNNIDIRLISFVPLKYFFSEKVKIKKEFHNVIIIPMFLNLKRWKIYRFFLGLYLKKNQIVICRGIFAANIAMLIKNSHHKIIYDGRGAVNAEQVEYGVYNNTGLENEIFNIEKKAVLNSDLRIAVSNKLIKYWKQEFNYNSQNHVVIPSSSNNNIVDINKIKRNELNISENTILIVFSGSFSKWHSFPKMIVDFKMFLNNDSNIKILFLSKPNPYINEIKNMFSKRVLVRWVKFEEVIDYLRIADYGYVVRENTVTNQVASPVKVAEYLSCGLKILISNDLGDYTEIVEQNNLGFILNNSFNYKLSKVDLKESESIINFYEKNLAIWSNEISNRYLNLIK